MSFSGVLVVSRIGRMVLPSAARGTVAIEFASLPFARLLTRVSVTANGASIVVPAALRALMTLPSREAVTVRSYEHGHTEPTLEPIGDAFEFLANAKRHKSSLSATIPMSWTRTVSGWDVVRVETAGHSNVVRLRSNNQGIIGIPLPQDLSGGAMRVRITRVDVSAGAVDKQRDNSVMDWGAVPFDGLRVLEITNGDSRVRLPTQRSQLMIKRLTSIEETMWLLGFYRADGTKRQFGFSVSNKSRLLIARARDVLFGFGLTRKDLYLTLIAGTASRERTESYYAPLDLDVSRFRQDGPSDKPREFGATLHVRDSLGFTGLMNAALLVDLQEFSDAARLAFLRGFLDGDGTITRSNMMRLQASCSDEIEAKILTMLFDEYLGTVSEAEATISGGCWPVNRTVTGFTAVRLIDDGMFTANMSRPRLFYVAHRVLYPTEIHAVHKRWGYVGANNKPTKETLAARTVLAKYDHEWAFIQWHYPTEESASPGRKGALYEYDPAWKQPKPSPWAKVRARQESNDPSVHHPIEKQTQIRATLDGLSGLDIYEAHAGEGGCTEAYREFGNVTSSTATDGNDVDVIMQRQLEDPARFDVIDLDPYGYPFKVLMAGALRLLKPDGFLFVTCPDPAKNYRGATKRIQEALFPSGPDPFDAEAVIDWIERLGILHGMQLVLASRVDLPTVWRFAFKAERL